MERIVLEVDDATGKAYQRFSQETRKKLNEAISILLKKAINDASSNSYKKTLDDLGAEAMTNGLTQDILDDLLLSND